MKNNKKVGITYFTMIVTVVLAMIILSTIVIEYTQVVNKTKKSEFAKEIYFLRQQILNYEFMNSNYPLDENLSIDLNNINIDSRIQFSNEPDYETNNIVLNTIDLTELDVDNIIRGTKKYGDDDIYVFSSNTKKLYYLKGESVDDNVYYTLTDDLYDLLDISEVK